MISRIKKKSGYTLIEIIVGVGLISLITVGVSVVILNMQKNRKRQELIATLTKLKIEFENNIKNNASWNATLNYATNTSLECVRRKVQCNGLAPVTPPVPGNFVNSAPITTFVNNAASELVLLSNSGPPVKVFFDGRTTSTNGFMENGMSCNGFTLAPVGNDNCPIGYVVNWRALSGDINPQILVSAKMIYNPGNNNSNKSFINSASISSNNTKYDINILRARDNIIKNFQAVVRYAPAGGGGQCQRYGFGICTKPPGWYIYTDYSTNITYGGIDTFGLAAADTTGVTFTQKGRYRCSVITSAFGVGNATSQLEQISPIYKVLSTKGVSVDRNKYEYVNIQHSVDLDVPTPNSVKIRISQQCTDDVPYYVWTGFPMYTVDSTVNYCGLGFPSSASYGDAKTHKASISCSLLE